MAKQLKLKTNDIDIHIARTILQNQKFSPEARILAEIIRLSKTKSKLPSIFLYNYLPGHLFISKDVYRKAISILIKQKLINRINSEIKLCTNLQDVDSIIIKQN